MMRRLRLGIVTSGFPYTAKETFLSAEIRVLANAGVATCIYPTNPQLKTARFATPTPSVRIPLLSMSVLGQALLECAVNPARVLDALRSVVLRGTWSSRWKNAAVFCKALAVARDMRSRGIDHVHAYWASTPATVAFIVAMLNRVNWSFTAHRWDIYEDNLLADKVRHAQFARVISRRGRAAILERTSGAFGKVRLLHLGVADAGMATSDASAGRPCTLLCAANLVPVKGHRFLIEALRLVAARGVRVRCVLAGGGPQREELARAIAAADLVETVTIAGVVSHERLLADLSAGEYDAAVLASTEEGDLHEGIPVFLIEAMAAGVPCIATRTGSIEELIDGEVGVLVEQRDPAALSRAIELVAGDADLRRKLGFAARQRVAKRFLAERLGAELLTWIQADDSAVTRRTISETMLVRS